ncbi:hypothetical protein ACQKWADRAFT_292701 [Trichoderma austrokoningii]
MADVAITTPYILYYIFLHLPQQDLLLAQRVCRTWHDVISSSKALQAALFLCPEPAKTAARSDASFELNPLLQSRFPSFFDIDCMFGSDESVPHDIGPWFHSHWTENIHPWPKRQNRCGRQPRPFQSPELDPRRAAAYKHPDASWRRMLPCMPPPVELQVDFEYHVPARAGPRRTLYTLRSLKFSNEFVPDKAVSTALQDGQQPWLTFGLLHDIIEAAWFRGIPTLVDSARFDYSFQEARPWIFKPSLTPGQRSRPTPEERATMNRYGRREKLRDLFPDKKIGGPGRIFVPLSGSEVMRCYKKRYSGQFEVDRRVVEQLEWDEEIDYDW